MRIIKYNCRYNDYYFLDNNHEIYNYISGKWLGGNIDNYERYGVVYIESVFKLKQNKYRFSNDIHVWWKSIYYICG